MNPLDQTNSLSAAPAPPEENEADELSMEAEGDLLRVTGDVDLYVASAFQKQGTAYVRAAAAPLLDMRGVSFVDSAGLAALVSLAREAQSSGKTLRLRIAGSPRRVLRITGIDQMITVEE
jgi:anti-sigma B factor antagonist